MKNFRKACRGEKGFTLIELLVVIMILGVLAAVVTLAVTRFIGKGTVESANAEVVTVQAAVEACLADANSGRFDSAAGYDWQGGATQNPTVTKGTSTWDADSYLRTHELKASYHISPTGDITGATDVSWGGLTWDNGTWTKP